MGAYPKKEMKSSDIETRKRVNANIRHKTQKHRTQLKEKYLDNFTKEVKREREGKC